jgi:hypothetical protein
LGLIFSVFTLLTHAAILQIGGCGNYLITGSTFRLRCSGTGNCATIGTGTIGGQTSTYVRLEDLCNGTYSGVTVWLDAISIVEEPDVTEVTGIVIETEN